MCHISSYFISLSANFFIKVVMGPDFGNFFRDHKFFDTSPNKSVSPTLESEQPVTALVNGIWRVQCFVTPEAKSSKVLYLRLVLLE